MITESHRKKAEETWSDKSRGTGIVKDWHMRQHMEGRTEGRICKEQPNKAARLVQDAAQDGQDAQGVSEWDERRRGS